MKKYCVAYGDNDFVLRQQIINANSPIEAVENSKANFIFQEYNKQFDDVEVEEGEDEPESDLTSKTDIEEINEKLGECANNVDSSFSIIEIPQN